MNGSKALSLLLTLACALGLAREAQARAWTRDAGEGTVRLSYAYIGADEFYGRDGRRLEIPDYQQHSVQFFAEVGVVDRWLTLSAEGTAYRWNHLEGFGSSQGPGDVRLGAWTGLLATSSLRVTAGVLVGLPTGDDRESIVRTIPPGVRLPPGLVEPLSPEVVPDLRNGDGEFDFEPRIALGSDLAFLPSPFQHFAELEFGVWWHTDQDEALTYSLKLGTKLPYGVLDRVWWILSLYGVESLASEREVEVVLTGLGNGASVTGFGFEASCELITSGPARLEAFVRLDGALRARALPSAAMISFGLGASF